jgi:hypothetical protein
MSEPRWRWRMIIQGSFREAWIDATPELREEIFAAWIAIHHEWQEKGCRLIVTMDDVTVVGRASTSRPNFYAVWEIPEPGMVRDLLTPFWDEDGERPLRLSGYFSLEAILGKPIITMEQQLGGPTRATQAGE